VSDIGKRDAANSESKKQNFEVAAANAEVQLTHAPKQKEGKENDSCNAQRRKFHSGCGLDSKFGPFGQADRENVKSN
jgi:hypothetical protein